jgi:hypothetical protein
VGEGPAGGTDLAAAGRASTRWGQEDDTAADTAGAGVQPCQGAALAEVEEGGWCSYARAAADRRRWQAAGSQAAASEGASGPGQPGEGTWRVLVWLEGAWKRG